MTKRYKIVQTVTDRSKVTELIEHDYGDWVRWEDYKTLLEEQYMALSALNKLEDVARGCEDLAIKYFQTIKFLEEGGKYD